MSHMQNAALCSQELEKRYYNNIGLSDAAKAGRAAVADVATLAAFFSQRVWASLTLPSSSDGSTAKQVTESDYRELDSQLDEVRCSHWPVLACCHSCITTCFSMPWKQLHGLWHCA